MQIHRLHNYYISCTCSFMKEHYEELQSLFKLDPLLVFAVAYICPRCDIADLCDRIHLPYAIALVNRNILGSSVLDTGWETEVKCMHNLLLNCHVHHQTSQFQTVLIGPLSVLQKRVIEADTFE